MKWQISNLRLLLAAVVIYCSNACTPMIRTISPEPTAAKTTVFDRYELEIHGVVSNYPHMTIRAYFTSKVPEMAAYDTIPILVIDELCFTGPCLSEEICRAAISGEEYYGKMSRELHLQRTIQEEPFRDNDLWARNGVLVPDDYLVEKTPKLPSACENTIITITVHARILDRKTHKELARESKPAQFKVKWERAGSF